MIASGLLVAMLVLFALARHLAGTYPGWGWVRAFSEAALVGGLADWFAVTALFRDPLFRDPRGLQIPHTAIRLHIPHTAIIPNKKNDIADAMEKFLLTHFLQPQMVLKYVEDVNLASVVGGFLSDPRRMGEAGLLQAAGGLLGDVLQSPDGEQLGAMVKSAVHRQLEQLDIATLLGQLLSEAIADQRHLPLIEAALRLTGPALTEIEDLVRGMIHDQVGVLSWIGLDKPVATRLLNGLYRVIEECSGNPDHPLRMKMEARLVTLAHDLIHDPALRAKVSGMKADLLANHTMAARLDGLWHRAHIALLRTARDPAQALSGRFGAWLGAFGRSLQQDVALQQLVNRFARDTLVEQVARHGGAIAKYVSETVKGWDEDTMTKSIEDLVGDDLQYIRLSGTLVGGMVGVVLYAIDRLI